MQIWEGKKYPHRKKNCAIDPANCLATPTYQVCYLIPSELGEISISQKNLFFLWEHVNTRRTSFNRSSHPIQISRAFWVSSGVIKSRYQGRFGCLTVLFLSWRVRCHPILISRAFGVSSHPILELQTLFSSCPGWRPAFRVFPCVWISSCSSVTSDDSTSGEKAGDLEVLDCFQQLKLL